MSPSRPRYQPSAERSPSRSHMGNNNNTAQGKSVEGYDLKSPSASPRARGNSSHRSPDRKEAERNYGCYYCGEATHFVKDCPRKASESKQVQIKPEPEYFASNSERR